MQLSFHCVYIFHFSQATYRKIVELGYTTRYRDDTSFNQAIRMLAALAFSPLEPTINCFEKPFSEFDFPTEIVDYFEDTYLWRPNRKWSRRNPRFHVSMWNVYDRAVDNLPRINNSVEGFHKGFESMLQATKPDVWKFLDAIQRQQTLQEFNYSQLKSGVKIND